MSVVFAIVIIAASAFLVSSIILIRMSLAERRERRLWQEYGINRNI